MFKFKINLDRHGPGPLSNIWLLPDPPFFSFPPTFKGIVQPFEMGGETRLIRSAVKIVRIWILYSIYSLHYSQRAHKSFCRKEKNRAEEEQLGKEINSSLSGRINCFICCHKEGEYEGWYSQSFIIRNSVYTLYAMRVSWSKDRHTLDTSSDNR